ncbi:TetR/AcrR family transcriptional regulator [Dyella silvae]|uniref:TetR/AcrR family transcriptional regulator n=1 Tax=Dyella silvae TaxID=2994424 RepID=UPI002264FEBD|nr:TetR/AcrR family transcriptional regulator [Dyella silvae]
MARAKSEDRRQAILSAATTLIASEGLGAATASIAKEAGVPSGSVFTYFETKNDLINQLYQELKLELVSAVLFQLPKKDPKKQLHHIWTQWTNWGVAFPEKRRVLAQLMVSDEISAASREHALKAASPTLGVIDQVRHQGVLKNRSLAFVGAIVEATATTTMDFMIREPKQAANYREAGFETLWKAIS